MEEFAFPGEIKTSTGDFFEYSPGTVGAVIAAARPTLREPSGDPARGANPVLVPYGVAIAAAALIVTIPPNFG